MTTWLQKKTPYAQFTIRTLLLGVLGLCVWLAGKGRSMHFEREGRASVTSIAGDVLYDYQVEKDGTLKETAQLSVPEWMRQLLGEEFFSYTAVVFVEEIEDKHLASIGRLPKLKGLFVSRSVISSEGICSLANASCLRAIHLDRCKTNEATIAALAMVPHLENFSMKHCTITDNAVETICRNKGLRTLGLVGCDIDDKCIESLASLPALDELDVSETLISDGGIARFCGMRPGCDVRAARRRTQ